MKKNILKKGIFIFLFLFLIVSSIFIFAYTQRSQEPQDTSASSVNIPTQYGAYFFYWHNCPTVSENCPDDGRFIYGQPVHTQRAYSVEFYKNEFADMKRAGLDMAFLDSHGDGHPTFYWYRDSSAVNLMTKALDELNNGLKLSYFLDTTSIAADWNQFKKKGYIKPLTNPNAELMPLSDANNWRFVYDDKIKLFYKILPKRHWATHNGKSVANGGRPIIVTYTAPFGVKDLEYTDELWLWVRDSFKKDFGVDPFIITHTSWIDPRYNTDYKNAEKVFDGASSWASGIDDLNIAKKRVILNGYTTAQIDPGFVCPRYNPNYNGCIDKSRNTTYFNSTTGTDSERMKSMFRTVAPGTDLIMVQTWNELWEGTSIQQNSNYPKTGGGFLPSDYYITELRSLIEANKSRPKIPNTQNSSPISNVGTPDCSRVIGWTCDPDDFFDLLKVDVYADAPFDKGGKYMTTVKANIDRGPGVASLCGGIPTHGFRFEIPSSLKDNKKHKLYFYVHNSITNKSEQIKEIVEINCK